MVRYQTILAFQWTTQTQVWPKVLLNIGVLLPQAYFHFHFKLKPQIVLKPKKQQTKVAWFVENQLKDITSYQDYLGFVNMNKSDPFVKSTHNLLKEVGYYQL